MLNTQQGALIENVSKEVMAFIDLPKKNSSDGSRSNLFGEYFVWAGLSSHCSSGLSDCFALWVQNHEERNLLSN